MFRPGWTDNSSGVPTGDFRGFPGLSARNPKTSEETLIFAPETNEKKMKKLILIAVSALFNITASAQLLWLDGFFEFKLGGYYLTSLPSESVYGYCGGDFYFSSKDKEEFDHFVQFVTDNEERIEKEFNVYFRIKEIKKQRIKRITEYYIVMEVLDVKRYDDYLAYLATKEERAKARYDAEKKKRMDNLDKVFQ